MTEEVESHIFKKYEILQKLGKGAYGIVWKVIDKKTKKVVALKKVFEAFHNETDAQRTFREVMILQELNNHDNVVKLLNVIKAENNKDLYLVFDFMETDLHSVIKAGILKRVHKQFIIYQLLKGLKYIHSGEIIHRDLKPSNILINSECHIKICDFGLARSVIGTDDEEDTIMTEYVATRWYRAPEIVLGSNKYSKKVDIWSVGCILAELINEKALFPGKSTFNQIELILDVIGKPSNEDLKSINSQNAVSIINSISLKQRKSFASHFKDTNQITIDFLQGCLRFDPDKRFTTEEALAHPFVSQFRDEKEETIMSSPVKIQIDDNQKLSIWEYREALYNDIIRKKKEERKIWRQKYLQSLGIDVKSDSVKKDLLKNLIERRRDTKETNQPTRQAELLTNIKGNIQNRRDTSQKPITFQENSQANKSSSTIIIESDKIPSGFANEVDKSKIDPLARRDKGPLKNTPTVKESSIASSLFKSKQSLQGSILPSKDKRTPSSGTNGNISGKPSTYQKISNYYRELFSNPKK